MLTIAQILPFLQPETLMRTTHEFYNESVAIRNEISECFGVKYPKYLDKNRPLEKGEQKKYRREVYENLWLDFPMKVSDRFDKIRQSDDFSVDYPKVELSNGIELLQTYTETKFGSYTSFTNWLFTEGKRWYLNDPNAVAFIIDKDGVQNDKDFIKPLVYVVPCDNVYSFRLGKFAALLSTLKSDIADQSGNIHKNKGEIWYFFDGESYTIATQRSVSTGVQGKVQSEFEILGLVSDEEGLTQFTPPLHYCEGLPCFKVGHLVQKRSEEGDELFVSVLTNGIPSIRQAQQRYSDLQIEFNFHVNSREWMYSFYECKRCSGSGKQTKSEAFNGIQYVAGDDCPHCSGSGIRPPTAMSTIYLKPAKTNIGEAASYPPSPPGGFIARSIEPAREIVLEIKRLEEKAWSAIDMAFVTETTHTQSGRAKELDREDMNTKLRAVASHFVHNLAEPMMKAIARQRYFVRFGLQADTFVPSFQLPVNFNLLDTGYIQEKLIEAQDKQLSPLLVGRYTQQILTRTFGSHSAQLKLEKLAELHDVMYGYGLVQKLTAYGGGRGSTMMAVKYTDYIISVRIYGFLRRAIIENDDFETLDYLAQHNILEAYANEVIADNPTNNIYDAQTMGTIRPPLDLVNFGNV